MLLNFYIWTSYTEYSNKRKKEENKKKLTFENIDTKPELGLSLLLATSSDWLLELHDSWHGLYFHRFPFPIHFASCPLFCLLLRSITDDAAFLLLCEHTQSGENGFSCKWFIGSAAGHLWEQKREETPNKEHPSVSSINMQKKLSLFRGIFNFFTKWWHSVI